MRKLGLVTGMLLTAVLVAGGAKAAVFNTVDFWFARADDATGTAITNLNVNSGANFDVAVWYKTSDAWATSSLNLFTGWSSTSVRGTTAVAGDTKLTNVNGTTGYSNVMGNGWAAPTLNAVAGAKNADGSNGSYGSYLVMTWATPGGTTLATSPTKIGVLNLKNNMTANNEQYTMKIWAATSPSTFGYSSYLGQPLNQNNELSSTAMTVTSINTVPEPGSLLALGTGLMGLAGYVVRRRK